ncbi:MAG TPA: hypothetical protein VER76_20180, partial [Pyrinomonadaceae bacterium]|nr:hypothetical protein [Pyrinomonadaceae bacterium]
MRRRNQQKTLIVGVIAALLGFALVALLMSRGNRPNNPPAAPQQQTQTTTETSRQNPAQDTTSDDAAATAADTPTAQTTAPTAAPAQPQASTQPRADGESSDSVIAMLFGADDIKAGPNAPP